MAKVGCLPGPLVLLPFVLPPLPPSPFVLPTSYNLPITHLPLSLSNSHTPAKMVHTNGAVAKGETFL